MGKVYTGLMLFAAGMPPEERQRSLILIAVCVGLIVLVLVGIVALSPPGQRKAVAFSWVGAMIGMLAIALICLLLGWLFLS
jgi:hypothetical protein